MLRQVPTVFGNEVLQIHLIVAMSAVFIFKQEKARFQ